MKNIVFTLFIALIAFVDTVNAQSNPKISIQGILREASGVAVEDGEYDLVFRIYTNINDPISDHLYEEEHPGVTVANGIYSVHLGSYLSMGYLTFDKPYFVGVQVGSTELQPRIELTHSPYSMAARSVSCSGAVGDIKYSILDWDDFQLANGDCWIPMDGRTIAGTTALAQEFGITQAPDMSGLFIRAHEWYDGNDPDRTPISPIATIQNDALHDHEHAVDLETSSDGKHSHSFTRYLWHRSFTGSDSSNDFDINVVKGPASGSSAFADTEVTEDAPNHKHDVEGNTSSVNSTGSVNVSNEETRSKNMNFYIYIRIN